jgi:hypothetical protein
MQGLIKCDGDCQTLIERYILRCVAWGSVYWTQGERRMTAALALQIPDRRGRRCKLWPNDLENSSHSWAGGGLP